MRHKLILAALAVTALGVVAAGCGGTSYGGSSASSKPASTTDNASSTTSSGAGTTVSTAKNKLGTILVGSNGRTLYLFEKDSGGKSACKSGGCAALWPPLTTTGKPTAGGGVDASKLSTTAGASGAKIVTYNGHPLYFYAPDTSPGQTTGQAINSFGADWFVLGAKGNVIKSGDDDSGDDSNSAPAKGGAY